MGNSYTIITKSAQETKRFGQTLADSLMGKRGKEKNQPLVICLSGELGSGKTTFVQGFAKGLGVTSRLLSPTFIIVRRYSVLDKKIFFYHVDLYRIKNTADLDGLGLREIFSDPFAITCIEWPEQLGSLLPKTRTDIMFEVIGEEERKIMVNLRP
ncbi:TPA: tRNA (adenosine(37)-N6)-threonylcarbamoyltransferase complex ATPase subunit type 1 TsaE [Patescibacteria group bacterium]|nr:tRNA (adenosine(37)-N6)-threonylcarbamoyltransferase complex ATPase subunit type 1 TsaE [Patescibacteria group bacterium]